MNKENCALKLVDEIILYYDARSNKDKKKFNEHFRWNAVTRFLIQWYNLAVRWGDHIFGEYNLEILLNLWRRSHCLCMSCWWWRVRNMWVVVVRIRIKCIAYVPKGSNLIVLQAALCEGIVSFWHGTLRRFHIPVRDYIPTSTLQCLTMRGIEVILLP